MLFFSQNGEKQHQISHGTGKTELSKQFWEENIKVDKLLILITNMLQNINNQNSKVLLALENQGGPRHKPVPKQWSNPSWGHWTQGESIQQMMFEKMFTHQVRETNVIFYASNKIQLQNIVDYQIGNHKNPRRKHKGILLLEKMPVICRAQRRKAKTEWENHKTFLFWKINNMKG